MITNLSPLIHKQTAERFCKPTASLHTEGYLSLEEVTRAVLTIAIQEVKDKSLRWIGRKQILLALKKLNLQGDKK
jgi:hypothetical protein